MPILKDNGSYNKSDKKYDYDFQNIIFSLNNQLITISSKNIKWWDTENGKLLHELKPPTRISNVNFSSDGKLIAVAFPWEKVELWKIFPSTQELINYAKEQLPLIIDGENPPRRRTLTCEERQRFFCIWFNKNNSNCYFRTNRTSH